MKNYLMSILFFSPVLVAENLCQYGKANTCPKNKYCIRMDKKKSLCKSIPIAKLPIIFFPFRELQEVTCDQGHLEPEGNSHSWFNTAFALDLFTNRNGKKEKPIYAGISGKVISFNNCKTKNDRCGGGFGNHVKILGKDGVLVFYAHLKNVFVKTGENVKRGSLIGHEGMTGWTGLANPHLHLSVHYDWRKQNFKTWQKYVGYLPSSIPFQMRFCSPCSDSCIEKLMDIRKIKCKRNNTKVTKICKKR